MKKFAIILSGCGVFDGAEIHEATLTMLSVMKNGATYELFAPNVEQHHVVNHFTQEEMNETRNVLVESARIARGNIKDLVSYDPKDFDGLIMPGGFGVAKNLSDFAFKGALCSVIELLKKALLATYEAQKPIGALCISPAIVAKVLTNAKVTIGQDKGTAEVIKEMGGEHVNTNHGEVVYDEKHKIFTTPCYMLDATILDIWNGADNIVKAILKSL